MTFVLNSENEQEWNVSSVRGNTVWKTPVAGLTFLGFERQWGWLWHRESPIGMMPCKVCRTWLEYFVSRKIRSDWTKKVFEPWSVNRAHFKLVQILFGKKWATNLTLGRTTIAISLEEILVTLIWKCRKIYRLRDIWGRYSKTWW